MRKHVTLTRVNKIEAMYGRSRVNVKVELRSSFTFRLGLSYIASISFKHVNSTYICREKLRDNGNQPLRDKTAKHLCVRKQDRAITCAFCLYSNVFWDPFLESPDN